MACVVLGGVVFFSDGHSGLLLVGIENLWKDTWALVLGLESERCGGCPWLALGSVDSWLSPMHGNVSNVSPSKWVCFP